MKRKNDFESLVRRCADRAAMLIRIHGWHRGMRGGGRGRNGELCAMAAIYDAATQVVPGSQENKDHIACVVRIRAERVIDPSGRCRERTRRKKYLAYWNDKADQKVDNVLRVLRKVRDGHGSNEWLQQQPGFRW